jgi:hypothetical protein
MLHLLRRTGRRISSYWRVRGDDPMAIAPQVRDAATAVDPSLRLVNLQRANEVNNDVLWVMNPLLRSREL